MTRQAHFIFASFIALLCSSSWTSALADEARALEWIYSKPAGVEFTKTEVTIAQYRVCVEAGKCKEPVMKSDDKKCNWGYPDRDLHPVNCVNWRKSKAFCEWAGGNLPSKEEWLAEASNGSTRKFPWGDTKVTCDYAIWGDGFAPDGCGRRGTWPVCSKPRGNSISGLCDMSGNVSEWLALAPGQWAGSTVTQGGNYITSAQKSLYVSSSAKANPKRWRPVSGFRCVRARTAVVDKKPRKESPLVDLSLVPDYLKKQIGHSEEINELVKSNMADCAKTVVVVESYIDKHEAEFVALAKTSKAHIAKLNAGESPDVAQAIMAYLGVKLGEMMPVQKEFSKKCPEQFKTLEVSLQKMVGK